MLYKTLSSQAGILDTEGKDGKLLRETMSSANCLKMSMDTLAQPLFRLFYISITVVA